MCHWAPVSGKAVGSIVSKPEDLSTLHQRSAGATGQQRPREKGRTDDRSIPMARTALLGLPRVGPDRELKFALEAHWAGRLGAAELQETARGLRAASCSGRRPPGSM